jgi:integrase
VVYLTDRAREVLLEHFPVPGNDGTFVFASPRTGRPWTSVQKMWKRACSAAGLGDDVWIHDLRRSFATRARKDARIEESVVMRMGGWKTRAVFERYNIVVDDDVREAAKRLRASSAGTGRNLDDRKNGGGEND